MSAPTNEAESPSPRTLSETMHAPVDGVPPSLFQGIVDARVAQVMEGAFPDFGMEHVEHWHEIRTLVETAYRLGLADGVTRLAHIVKGEPR